MPVKRRSSKSRRWRITPEAVARWRQVRPHGIYFGAGLLGPDPGRHPASFVDDEELASLVGQPVLFAMADEDAEALFEAIE